MGRVDLALWISLGFWAIFGVGPIGFVYRDQVAETLLTVLNHQGLAAWVQAIGSIAAIVGSFVLASTQHQKQLRADEVRRRKDYRDSMSQVLVGCRKVIDLAQDIELHFADAEHVRIWFDSPDWEWRAKDAEEQVDRICAAMLPVSVATMGAHDLRDHFKRLVPELKSVRGCIGAVDQDGFQAWRTTARSRAREMLVIVKRVGDAMQLVDGEIQALA